MAIRGAAILLLFSVLLVFFVPAGAGPFSAVHGPVTALRANRAAQVFYFNLAFPSRNPVPPLTFGLLGEAWLGTIHAILIQIDAPDSFPALRC